MREIAHTAICFQVKQIAIIVAEAEDAAQEVFLRLPLS